MSMLTKGFALLVIMIAVIGCASTAIADDAAPVEAPVEVEAPAEAGADAVAEDDGAEDADAGDPEGGDGSAD